jgi:4-oxalocrotonate tautomerase family enzyme
MSVASDAPRSLGDVAYERIRRDIVRCELEPGREITESQVTADDHERDSVESRGGEDQRGGTPHERAPDRERATVERSPPMPLVTVEFLPGRSKETKEKLVKAITDAMVDIGGGTRDHCWVIIRETPAENWSIGGHLVSSEAFADVMKAYNKRMSK